MDKSLQTDKQTNMHRCIHAYMHQRIHTSLYIPFHSIPLHCIALHSIALQLHHIHYTHWRHFMHYVHYMHYIHNMQYVTHYVTLRRITLHHNTSHYIWYLAYITWEYINYMHVMNHTQYSIQYITLHYITLRYITLRYTALHYMTRIGAATEHLDKNRERAPSGPVKVAFNPKPHERHLSGVSVVSGISTVIAGFPAGWASKTTPFFLQGQVGCGRRSPKYLSRLFKMHSASRPALLAGATSKRTLLGAFGRSALQTTKPLALTSGSLKNGQSEGLKQVIEGYGRNLIQPSVMLAFVPMGPVRVVLEVITPSEGGIPPERWQQDATVCPPNWATDYSLLRGC